jgi:ribosome-binding protein aMBF1 (putative translation factor)
MRGFSLSRLQLPDRTPARKTVKKTNSDKDQTKGYLPGNRLWRKISWTNMSTSKMTGGTEIRRVFALNLKRLRELQHISQLQLSSMTGLTHNFINDIEKCRKWVSPESLAKLAAALRVQPFQFFISEFLTGK